MAYVYKQDINWKRVAPIIPSFTLLCYIFLNHIRRGDQFSFGFFVSLMAALAGSLFFLSRVRIGIGPDGFVLYPFRKLAKVRSFHWDEVNSVMLQSFTLMGKKAPAIRFVFDAGESFHLMLADIRGRPTWVPADGGDAPPLADAVSQFCKRPVQVGGDVPLSSAQADLGREAAHVSAAAVGLAVGAVFLMLASGQHFFNSREYIPYLVAFSILTGAVAIRYQWRLPSRINMVLPTLLVMATAAWFCWASLLELASFAGKPITADFVAESAKEAGAGSLESEQYWHSDDPRLPVGEAGTLLLWADPGHFRYGLGQSLPLKVRVIPVLGIATIGRNEYMDMLKPLPQLPAAKPLAPKSLPAAEGIVGAAASPP